MNVQTLRQFLLAWTIVGIGLQFMHVGCDAAECHHHILGYLKIDLPACVCVCALLLSTGPLLVYRPFFHALISALMQWCSKDMELLWDNWIHVLPHTHTHTHAGTHACTHAWTYVHIHTEAVMQFVIFFRCTHNAPHLMHD